MQDDVKKDLIARFKSLPAWAQAVVIAVTALAIAAYQRYAGPEPVAPQVIVQPAPVVVQPAPVPVPVQAQSDDGPRLRHRIVGFLARKRLADRLQVDGFAMIGGDPTPLTREQAEEAVDRLTDRVVYHAGAASGFGAGDGEAGPLLQFIRDAIQWIRDHPEEVQQWLRLLMTILMSLLAL